MLSPSTPRHWGTPVMRSIPIYWGITIYQDAPPMNCGTQQSAIFPDQETQFPSIPVLYNAEKLAAHVQLFAFADVRLKESKEPAKKC